jgi:hypothetical protein
VRRMRKAKERAHHACLASHFAWHQSWMSCST